MADVARRAGVSLKTVSRVVNGEPSVRSAVRDRVLAAARELGYRPNAAARALAARRSRVIGAVTPGSADFGPTSQLFRLERAAWEAGYSVVALDRLPGDLALPAVIPDQRAGSADATRHLLDLGHETVWHVSGPLGRKLAARGEVTAVFVANDQMALGIMHAFYEAGRRIPEDASIVGFDDVPEAEHLFIPLTTVRQDFEAAGRRAVAELLIRLGTDGGPVPEHDVVIRVELVVRASSGPPPRRRANRRRSTDPSKTYNRKEAGRTCEPTSAEQSSRRPSLRCRLCSPRAAVVATETVTGATATPHPPRRSRRKSSTRR